MSEQWRKELREYQLGMVMCVLLRAGEAKASGDVAEDAMTLAMAEGHPKEAWSSLHPSTISGHLRVLYNIGHVLQPGERHNPRYGRTEPLWEPSHHGRREWGTAVPHAPEKPGDSPPARASAPVQQALQRDALETVSRENLIAILQVREEMAARVTTFLADMSALALRAQRALAGKEGSHG